MKNLKMKKEFKVIADLLPNNTRVLDVGCGDGSLMNLLVKEKNIEVRGLELEKNNVQECIYKGLPVIQGNAETELYQFPNQSFDYVILSQTLQAFINPDKVLKELLRIGKSVVVSIPNFGYWKVRTSLLFFGKMPVTKNLPNKWYNTPNLHMCTIKDLFKYCDNQNINIKKVIGLNEDNTSLINRSNLELKNFFSKLGIFLIG
jgi:methionine biosynthesis protein MetW